MKKCTFYISVLTALCFLAGCNDDPSTNYKATYVSGIINEGTFQAGNGELSYYDEDSKIMKNKFFNSANGFDIGSSIQSAGLTQSGVLALVCNTPDKIFFMDAISGKVLFPSAFTDQLKSPRGVVMAENSYGISAAYVTNWGEPRVIGEWEPGFPMHDYPHSYILEINLSNSGATTGRKIPCGNTAEGILLYQNKLFVALQEGVKVYNINTLDSIAMIKPETLTGAAKQLVIDNNNNVWVSINNSGLMGFSAIDYSNKKEYNVTVNYDGKIALSADGTSIYTYDADYTNPGNSNVYKINLSNGTSSILLTESNSLYGIGVNAHTGKIYTSNPNDYVSNSTICIYNQDGSLFDKKTSGVLSSGFFFFGYYSEE